MTLIALHAGIAIAAVVLLILVPRVEPVIALVIGSIYLGLASGLGFDDTMKTIVDGFGDIMAEVGLLIGFGVLLGSLLNSMGALQKLVEKLLRALGPGKLSYALAAALTAVFPSIYVDVQLVLAAPLARSAAPRMGRDGLALMGGALSAGILVGYVFVVPGLGTLAVAGLLDVPLGTMLIYGFVLGPVTALLTVFLYHRLLKRGFWNKERDEAVGDRDEAVRETDAAGEAADGGETEGRTERRTPPLTVSLLPIVVPLLLIATGAIAEAAGVESDVLTFLGDPAFALFVGLLGGYALAKRALTGEQLGESMTQGFNSTGQILLVTGVGGSLGAVIGKSGLDDTLAGVFSADAGMPVVVTVLLVWLVAALLHLAIGSIAVAAIAAAGIVAPIMGSLDVPAEVLALAIGSGSLFALQVNSNFFWMFQTLLGVTTRGALKALTFVTALASVVSLVLVLGVSLVT
ncbi:SLC13 family permease [Streptomyces albiaxialis]|uniref:SLC13 family permease n=1 Tax=Streptomyces albiaxialis TaxID=329523 RepID=A0ABN2WUZ2_9ACTN